MPSQHDEYFKAYAAPALLAVRGETIGFTPKGGVRRSIQAIVKREPPARVPAGKPQQQGAVPRLTVEVIDDATDGVSIAQLNTGGDQFHLEYEPGKGEENFFLAQKPKGQTGGMLRFEIA
jgi:hypothetical protein